jgi:hypothetical protein
MLSYTCAFPIPHTVHKPGHTDAELNDDLITNLEMSTGKSNYIIQVIVELVL